MTCLVTGGRDYTNWAQLQTVLDRLHAKRPITLLVHGAAKGADSLADRWATIRGVPRHAHPVCDADWAMHGRGAGHIRNARMVAMEQPDVVVAFPGGKGAASCVWVAQARKIRVLQVLPVLDGSAAAPVQWI